LIQADSLLSTSSPYWKSFKSKKNTAEIFHGKQLTDTQTQSAETVRPKMKDLEDGNYLKTFSIRIMFRP